MTKFNLLLSALFLAFTGSAQSPDQLLNNLGAQGPIEKSYLQLDRSDYIAGQTIWFKAYQYADMLPSLQSTTLYVELLNGSMAVVAKKIQPLFSGATTGQIELPDSLGAGLYTLRSYTPGMFSRDPEFIFRKRIFIASRKKGAAETPAAATGVRVEFFPEGGNFITGLLNTIAYKATYTDGSPAAIKGVIKKASGEKVGEVSSYHDGMGYVDLQPDAGTGYYLELLNDASGKKYVLPEATTKGVVLKVISNGNNKFFEVLQSKTDPVFKAAYMIGQMQHHLVFRTELTAEKEEIHGTIQTGTLSSGILHITVFNKDGLPLAERLTFVNNKEYRQPAELSLDTLDLAARGKNVFTLSMKDAVQGNFSLSIVDAAFETVAVREENIYSSLLLTSDLKGYIHDPAWYFSADTDSIQQSLDLVMMTNGWRRFKWETLLKGGALPKKYSDPGYISLAGRIMLDGTKKPFAQKELLLLVMTADNRRTMQVIRTDVDGNYKIDSLLFFDKARILFSDVKGKRSKFIEVKPGGDSLWRAITLPVMSLKDYPSPDRMSAAKTALVNNELDAILKQEGLLLEGVTVKTKVKTKLEQVEEKYVSGLFAGDALKTLDLTEEDLMSYGNIFEYLQSRVPGLEVNTNAPVDSPVVYFRQMASISAMGQLPVALFLDEVLQESTSVIAGIPANQVALVKVFSTFVGAPGGGGGGAVAIYTKKGGDYVQPNPAGGEVLNYRGYSVIKEFYSPDYSGNAKTKNEPDNRVTLKWDPAVFVNGMNPRIPIRFYNNDRTKRFRIVVEGLTSDGKMLMIEKTIPEEPRKAF